MTSEWPVIGFCDTSDNDSETLSVRAGVLRSGLGDFPTDNVSVSLFNVSQNVIYDYSGVSLHPSHNNAKILVDHVEPSADNNRLRYWRPRQTTFHI